MEITEALWEALTITPYELGDTAAVAIAMRLAEEIDATTNDPKLTGDLSIKLMTVLTALKMTPASRANVTTPKGEQHASVSGATAALYDLRAIRRERDDRAEGMDETS